MQHISIQIKQTLPEKVAAVVNNDLGSDISYPGPSHCMSLCISGMDKRRLCINYDFLFLSWGRHLQARQLVGYIHQQTLITIWETMPT